MRTTHPAPAVFLLAVFVLVADAWASGTESAVELIRQGRYTRAYLESMTWGDPSRLSGDQAYLRAHAAYQCLALDDARAAAQWARRLGCDAIWPGWLSASEIDRRVTLAERSLMDAHQVPSSSAQPLYLAYSSASEAFVSSVLECASEAYTAAMATAFGVAPSVWACYPVRLYVFLTNREASQFLEVLGLHAPTDGMAASIGLGVLMWERLDHEPACPTPYSITAALAHETLHVFQSTVGVEGGPLWLTEGAAMMAEDPVDPNHALHMRSRAIHAINREPGAIELALYENRASSYSRYPIYYLLATSVAAEFGVGSLGALMHRHAERPHETPAQAMVSVLGVTPSELVVRVRTRTESEEWAPARALAALAEQADDPARLAQGLIEASECWPGEPYLTYLAALCLKQSGHGAEALELARHLEDRGYLGCADGTMAQLIHGGGGRGADD